MGSASKNSVSCEPASGCRLCPRLAEFLDIQRQREPTWHNAPVPSFGDPEARMLIVGLAPGLNGANRTGRPFTGDHAGELLYSTLIACGFAVGCYGAANDDGLRLVDCMITNAVRCVPPQNKPTPLEIATCRPFLTQRFLQMPRLRVVLALGRIAHDQVLAALALPRARYLFAHGARHRLDDRLVLCDSYHCSRYNTNTGKLTTAMFHAVVSAIREELQRQA